MISALLLLAVGCGPRDVTVRGQVDRIRNPRTAFPLAGGTVRILDQHGEPYDEVTTDSDGFFAALAPRGQTIFAEVTGDSLAVTSFTGVSGMDKRLDVDPGTLYGFTDQEIADWRDRFAGCPGADGDGGVVLAQVKVSNLTDPTTGDHPLVTTATASTESADGITRDACYLDDKGVAYDPTKTETGPAGFVAIWDVPPGIQTLTVTYTMAEGVEYPTYTEVWMPDGGEGVVPRWPTWVQFPL